MIYLSGPMTGIENKNYPAFAEAAEELRASGHLVINPAELDVNVPRQTWAECLRRDIEALMQCHSVATLPGWKKSRGALLEVHIAEALGWPVHPVDYYLKYNKMSNRRVTISRTSKKA